MSNVSNSTLQPPAAASRIWLARILLLLLAIGFLLQLNCPLRLNTDAIVLLSICDSVAHSSGFLNRGQATVFPPARLAFLATALLVCLATAQVVRKTSRLSDFNTATQRVKTSELVARVISYRLTELRELFANFPSTKTPEKLRFVTPWIGFFALLLFLYGIVSKRVQIGPTEVFLVCYTAILFTWPYHDARFWLPVLPLLVAYCALAAQRLRLPAVLVTTYCLVFAVLGFGALAYSTQISFAGAKFQTSLAMVAYAQPTALPFNRAQWSPTPATLILKFCTCWRSTSKRRSRVHPRYSRPSSAT
jgi:hypothetical protein